MIIYSSKALKTRNTPQSIEVIEEQKQIKDIKPIDNKKKMKKTSSTPIIVEEPMVVEEEKTDLGEWLKEEIKE